MRTKVRRVLDSGSKKEFKRKFIELVGVHPEDFFSHKLHREKLADALGFDNFKKLFFGLDRY